MEIFPIYFSAEELDAIRTDVKAEAEAAVEYALAAKYPDEAEVDMHVFAANA